MLLKATLNFFLWVWKAGTTDSPLLFMQLDYNRIKLILWRLGTKTEKYYTLDFTNTSFK